jgi:hypothetical protein
MQSKGQTPVVLLNKKRVKDAAGANSLFIFPRSSRRSAAADLKRDFDEDAATSLTDVPSKGSLVADSSGKWNGRSGFRFNYF